MIFHAFLIKYAEIAIKGKNRYMFEDALVHQMNIALSKIEGEFEVKRNREESMYFARNNMIMRRLWKLFRECSVL